MNENQLLARIAINHRVMIGKPVIKGIRLTVEYILKQLALGVTSYQILQECDGLKSEDIQACFLFGKKGR